MLFAPALAVRSLVADLLPSRSLRRQLAAGLLAVACWHSVPNHAQLAQRFDTTVHHVWQLVEVTE